MDKFFVVLAAMTLSMLYSWLAAILSQRHQRSRLDVAKRYNKLIASGKLSDEEALRLSKTVNSMFDRKVQWNFALRSIGCLFRGWATPSQTSCPSDTQKEISSVTALAIKCRAASSPITFFMYKVLSFLIHLEITQIEITRYLSRVEVGVQKHAHT